MRKFDDYTRTKGSKRKMSREASRIETDLSGPSERQIWLSARLNGDESPDQTAEAKWAQQETVKGLVMALESLDQRLPLDLRAAIPDATERSEALEDDESEEDVLKSDVWEEDVSEEDLYRLNRLQKLLDGYASFYEENAKRFSNRLEIPSGTLRSVRSGQITGVRVPSSAGTYRPVSQESSEADKPTSTASDDTTTSRNEF